MWISVSKNGAISISQNNQLYQSWNPQGKVLPKQLPKSFDKEQIYWAGNLEWNPYTSDLEFFSK